MASGERARLVHCLRERDGVLTIAAAELEGLVATAAAGTDGKALYDWVREALAFVGFLSEKKADEAAATVLELLGPALARLDELARSDAKNVGRLAEQARAQAAREKAKATSDKSRLDGGLKPKTGRGAGLRRGR